MKYILLAIGLIICFNAVSQDLLSSRQTSLFTYIYKITDKQAYEILKYNHRKVEPFVLQNPIDSFLTGTDYQKILTSGHYVKVFINNNHLDYSYLQVPNCYVLVQNNNKDLQIKVYDTTGKPVSNAKVKINKHSISYHKNSQNYLIRKSNANGFITVKYNGFTNYFELERKINNPRISRLWEKFIYKTPAKYIWTPIYFTYRMSYNLITGRYYYYNFFWNIQNRYENVIEKFDCLLNDCENNYTGYIVTNKPRYKPLDTVKIKAYILRKRHLKPLTDTLDVFMYADKRYKIGKAKTNNSGNYIIEFVLIDSLKLKLDKQYSVEFVKDNGVSVMTTNFYYEDYQLKKMNLNLNFPQEVHFRNTPFNVFIKATDENNLNLPDARAEVLIIRKKVDKLFENKVFIPDTLWKHIINLDFTGETKVQIPDSLFPPANIIYQLKVRCNTADNELQTKEKEITYIHHKKEITFGLEQDSLNIKYMENNKSTIRKFSIKIMDANSIEIRNDSVMLPIKLKYKPYYSAVIVSGHQLKNEFIPTQEQSLVNVDLERTGDSLKIKSINPLQLPLNYQIYKTNKKIARGSGIEINYKLKTNSFKNYYLCLQYMWAGKTVEQTIEIPINENKLKINAQIPRTVYPGQETEVEIQVTDIKGKAAKNVDLTMYAFTNKFENYSPRVLPDFLKAKKVFTGINSFEIDLQSNDWTRNFSGNYGYWKQKTGLDSIEFFRFLFPEDKIYTYSFPTTDSSTLLSPFVINNGTIEPVYAVYVNYYPVYFGWNTNENPYVFPIRAGRNKIQIRTKSKEYTIDSVMIIKNHKNIISFDSNFHHDNIKSCARPEKLTEIEREHLSNFVFSYTTKLYSSTDFDYIMHSGRVFPLSTEYYRNHNQLTGPIIGFNTSYYQNCNHQFNFDFEKNYLYRFENPKIIMKELKITEILKSANPAILSETKTFRDAPVSEKEIIKSYKKHLLNNYLNNYNTNNYRNNYGYCNLFMEYEPKDSEPENQIRKIFIIEYFSQQVIDAFQYQFSFGNITPGKYLFCFVLNNLKYFFSEPFEINANMQTCIKINQPDTLFDDLEINNIEKIIQKLTDPISEIGLKGKTVIEEKLQPVNYFNGFVITGTVTDENGDGIPGATVRVKDSPNIGTITDLNGHYNIVAPKYSTLIFSFVGMETMESIVNSNIINPILMQSAQGVEEVVVTAIGIKRSEKSLGYSVSMVNSLQGRVAGVEITSNQGASSRFFLRGFSTMQDNNILYIIDGVPVQLGLNGGTDFGNATNDINPDDFENIEILDKNQAVALYGSRATNGAIVINTKSKKLSKKLQNSMSDEFLQQAFGNSSIRSKFSDYAIWQPNLTTNAEGKAKFKCRFPDDITSWNTYVLAMDSKKHSGQINFEIKSYKPLSAQLFLPEFLNFGDSAFIIGKSINYTSDTFDITTFFEINKNKTINKASKCINVQIDTTLLTTNQTDSIVVKYTLETSKDYFDGELRQIPVYPVGVEENSGTFHVLDKDTIINLSVSDTANQTVIYAQSNPLDILLQETYTLRNYKYLCNEQLASKLKALLVEKTIAEYRKEKFEFNADVKKIIRMLEERTNTEKLWGWWENGSTNFWISNHVLESFIEAKSHGYYVNFDTEALIWILVSELEKQPNINRTIDLLKILMAVQAKINFAKYLDIIKLDDIKDLTLKLEFIRLCQKCNYPVETKAILKWSSKTMFGSIFWDDENSRNYCVNNNNIINTLLAYNILSESNCSKDTLKKIRNYFFENRNNGKWRNTYEAAKIIETILPDMLEENTYTNDNLLVFKGDFCDTLSNFKNYSKTLNHIKNLEIEKKGKYPIFFTMYQQTWNHAPKPNSNGFKVSSQFISDNKSINKLIAGKPVKLEVTVKVENDAEFIMIEIPIPAGCTYGKKIQHEIYQEVHREYFKNQTSIFCEKLSKGEYTFTIDLVSRYSGTFNLNPAKAELMYFPVLYGRNGLEKVEIQQ